MELSINGWGNLNHQNLTCFFIQSQIELHCPQPYFLCKSSAPSFKMSWTRLLIICCKTHHHLCPIFSSNQKIYLKDQPHNWNLQMDPHSILCWCESGSCQPFFSALSESWNIFKDEWFIAVFCSITLFFWFFIKIYNSLINRSNNLPLMIILLPYSVSSLFRVLIFQAYDPSKSHQLCLNKILSIWLISTHG